MRRRVDDTVAMSPDGNPQMNPWQVMAHPVRRYLFELLAVWEAPVREIAEMVQCNYGIGWPAVTRHLKILHANGFVRVRREWNERYYRLDDEAIVRLEGSVAELRERWNDRRGAGYFAPRHIEDDLWPALRTTRRGIGADGELDRMMTEQGFDADKSTEGGAEGGAVAESPEAGD